jgi:hypothetical protein
MIKPQWPNRQAIPLRHCATAIAFLVSPSAQVLAYEEAPAVHSALVHELAWPPY